MRAVRRRLSYANVMSSIAVVLALGGASAFAAGQLGKNTVGTKQLKKSAVTEVKIAPDSVTGAKVKNGSLTGADIDSASLAAVPNAAKATSATRADTATHADSADNANHANEANTAGTAGNAATLQGSPPSAFVQGGGNFVSARRELTVGATNVAVLALPGIGSLTAECKAGPELGLSLANASGSTLDYASVSGSDLSPNVSSLANGANLLLADNINQVWEIELASRSTPATVATLRVVFAKSSPGPCVVFAQGTSGAG
ncbi:MAG: hypothetical protein ABW065_14555 [Solirubrobacterales bacterium]